MDKQIFLRLCQDGKLEEIRAALEAGQDPNTPAQVVPYKSISTPLMQAVRKNHDDVVKLLMEQNNIDINWRERFGESILYEAVNNGNKFAVYRLSCDQRLKTINKKCGLQDMTPLMLAVWLGHVDMVGFLMNNPHVDKDTKNAKGHDLEYVAKRNKINNNAEGLLRCIWAHKGIHITDTEQELENVKKELACEAEKQAKYLERLAFSKVPEREKIDDIAYCKDESKLRGALASGLDAKNQNESLIHHAMKGNLRMVELLLEHPNTDINAINWLAKTALMWACSQGHTAVVRALLAMGERITCHNQRTRGSDAGPKPTALEYAVAKGHSAVVREMVEDDKVKFNVEPHDKEDCSPIEKTIEKYLKRCENIETIWYTTSRGKVHQMVDRMKYLRIQKLVHEARQKREGNLTGGKKNNNNERQVGGVKAGRSPGTFQGPFNVPIGSKTVGKDLIFYTTFHHSPGEQCKEEIGTPKLQGPVSFIKDSSIYYPCNVKGCSNKCCCMLCRTSPCSSTCRTCTRCDECQVQCKTHKVKVQRKFINLNPSYSVNLNHIQSISSQSYTEVYGDDNRFVDTDTESEIGESLEKHPGISQECSLCQTDVKDHNENHHIVHNSCKLCKFVIKKLRYSTNIKEMKHEEEKSIAYEDTLCEFCSKKFCTKQKRQLHEGILHGYQAKCLNEANFNSSSESEAESDSESENESETPETESETELFDPDNGSDIEPEYVESEIKCDICNKEFSSEQQYSNHKYTHRERLQCPECPLTFTRNDNRTDHIVNVHKRTLDKIDYEYAQVTETKTYQCRHCGYETTSRKNYVEHKKIIHKRSEQKLHNCSQCSYETVRQGDLERHIQFIHKKAEIKCTQCSFKTTRQSDFSNHIKNVHSTGKFKCDKCECSDNQKKRLTQHIK